MCSDFFFKITVHKSFIFIQKTKKINRYTIGMLLKFNNPRIELSRKTSTLKRNIFINPELISLNRSSSSDVQTTEISVASPIIDIITIVIIGDESMGHGNGKTERYTRTRTARVVEPETVSLLQPRPDAAAKGRLTTDDVRFSIFFRNMSVFRG